MFSEKQSKSEKTPEDSHDAFQLVGIGELGEVLCDIDVVVVVVVVDELGDFDVDIGLGGFGKGESLVVMNLSMNGLISLIFLGQAQPEVEEELE
jgi:hypothetical protein